MYPMQYKLEKTSNVCSNRKCGTLKVIELKSLHQIWILNPLNYPFKKKLNSYKNKYIDGQKEKEYK